MILLNWMPYPLTCSNCLLPLMFPCLMCPAIYPAMCRARCSSASCNSYSNIFASRALCIVCPHALRALMLYVFSFHSCLVPCVLYVLISPFLVLSYSISRDFFVLFTCLWVLGILANLIQLKKMYPLNR